MAQLSANPKSSAAKTSRLVFATSGSLGNLLISLGVYYKKREKAIANGEEWKPSRMEPMESYDEKMVKEERLMLIERARDLDNKANGLESRAKNARLQGMAVQKQLMLIKT